MRVPTYNETPIEKWANDVLFIMKPFNLKYMNDYLIYDRGNIPATKKLIEQEMAKMGDIWEQYMNGVREGFSEHELFCLSKLEKVYYTFTTICKENGL